MKIPWAVLLCVWTVASVAHPLGNNSVNRQAAIKLGGQSVDIDYRLDLAEIPSLVASQAADVDNDGAVTPGEWQAYAEDWARSLLLAVSVTADGEALPLHSEPVDWQLQAGAAGLNCLRLRVLLRATAPRAAHAVLRYADNSRPDEGGWREVWVSTAAGARILATVAARHDRSDGLRRFPAPGAALLNETRAELEVAFDATAASAPPVAHASNSQHSGSTRAQSLAAMFVLGAHHIASGADHLVFLLGLVLLCRSLRALLAVVSAFTVAHSLTLGLAAAGLVTPPGSLVEPAIALSIAWVGACNLWRRHRSHGLAIAFGFGLIHGFGFAGALAETLGPHALDGHGWLLDLAAFNLGIESFQVALLCMVVPALRWGARLPWAGMARRCAALGVLWSGLVWFAWRVGSL